MGRFWRAEGTVLGTVDSHHISSPRPIASIDPSTTRSLRPERFSHHMQNRTLRLLRGLEAFYLDVAGFHGIQYQLYYFGLISLDGDALGC